MFGEQCSNIDSFLHRSGLTADKQVVLRVEDGGNADAHEG